MGYKDNFDIPSWFEWEYIILGDLPSEDNESGAIEISECVGGLLLTCAKKSATGSLGLSLLGHSPELIDFHIRINADMDDRGTLDYNFMVSSNINELRRVFSEEGKYDSDLLECFKRQDDCLTIFCHETLGFSIPLLLNKRIVENIQEFLNCVESLKPKEVA